MGKTISIALATYNGARYLPELFASLATQVYQPFELVVSDDSSTDDTVAIVKDFAEHAPFTVTLVENDRQLGIIENFYTALSNTNGELIAYCDQDDIWDPEKLSRAVACFADPDVKLVMHLSEVVNANLEPLGYTVPHVLENDAQQVVFPSTPDMSIGLGHQMLFDARIYHDFAWIFRSGIEAFDESANNYDTQFRFLAGFNGTIVCLDDTLVKFRRHEGATSDAGLMDAEAATASGFLGKKADDYLWQAKSLEAMATTFRERVLDSMPDYSDKLGAYIDFLQARAAIYRVRAMIYQSGNILQRFASYLGLVRQGVYVRKSERGLGRKALLVDLFVAFFGLSLSQRIIALKSA